MEGCVLTGSRALERIIRVRTGLIPDLLKRGLGAVRTDPGIGSVELSGLIARLRDGGAHPNLKITFAVDYAPILNLTRLCQAQIDVEEAGKKIPAR